MNLFIKVKKVVLEKRLIKTLKKKIYPYSNLPDKKLKCVKCKRNIKIKYQEIVKK